MINSGTDIEQDAFEKLSLEVKLVIDFNGKILSMNENAKHLLNEEDSFYDSIDEGYHDVAYYFINKLIHEDNSVQSILLCHTSNHRRLVRMKYHGLANERKIYLKGFILDDDKSQNGFPTRYNESLNLKESVFKEFLSKQVDMAILLINQNSIIHFVNNAFKDMFKVTESASLIGEKVYDLKGNQSLRAHLLEIIKDVRSRKRVSEHYIYINDSLFLIHGVYLDDGTICFAIQDRSYQQRFENLLIYKQQMESVSQLAAGVAHELRNPLSVIRGFMQLSKLTNDWDKYYHTIISELTRMNDIIEDFLSVSRKKVEKKKLSPSVIFQSLIYIIRSECTLHNITFEHHILDTDYKVNVNETMIKQILLNLLRNTIEAYEGIKQNRYLKLSTEIKENKYKVSVIDHGPGIDDAVLERLGTPFFTTKEKGNGIGIPLSKKIIEEHGGEFIVHSQVNEGTTVTFTLPLVSNDG